MTKLNLNDFYLRNKVWVLLKEVEGVEHRAIDIEST